VAIIFPGFAGVAGNHGEILSIRPEQKADPKIIPYWYAPYRLMKEPTKSQPFMKYLEKWLYGETSAQAHLNPAGLFSIGGFVLADFAPEIEQQYSKPQA